MIRRHVVAPQERIMCFHDLLLWTFTSPKNPSDPVTPLSEEALSAEPFGSSQSRSLKPLELQERFHAHFPSSTMQVIEITRIFVLARTAVAERTAWLLSGPFTGRKRSFQNLASRSRLTDRSVFSVRRSAEGGLSSLDFSETREIWLRRPYRMRSPSYGG
jgi:hypothetical protein